MVKTASKHSCSNGAAGVAPDTGRARAARARGGALGLSAEGASPSNTAPSNYNGTLILRTGIDSLYVSYPGDLRQDLEPILESRKTAAQSEDTETQKEATVLLTDQPYAVSGKGKGRFSYVLTHNWYHVQVSSTRAKRLPLAYVQIRSEVLTLAPLADVIGSLNLAAEVLGGKIVQPKVSRVDLCVDFTTDQDLEAIPLEHWVRRSVGYARYYDRDRFSGLVFGQGGPISCRLYDKTLEIQKSQKTYLYDLWKAQGWDGQSPVWRLEFQLKGDVLRELQIRSISGLIEHLNALWDYCTGRWLRLCEPDGGANQSRWPMAPLWEYLASAMFNDAPVMQLRRIRKDMSPSDQSLFVNGLGALTSFMAREGIDSLQDGIARFFHEAHDYHRRTSQQSGQVLTSYVREKVEQKRTRFNARTAADFDKKTRGLK